MHRNRIIRKFWGFFLLCLLFTGCSKEIEIPVDSGIEEELPGGIQIVINTPSPDEVLTPASTKAPGGVTKYPDEAHEWSVKKLGVYIFKKTGTGSADADFTLLKSTEGIVFIPQATAGTGGNLKDGQGIDNGHGSYSYTEKITSDMLNSTLKILIVANEEALIQSPADDNIALNQFKQKVASAKYVHTNSKADVISGGMYDFSQNALNADYKGIVMSAVAQTDQQADELVIGAGGVNYSMSALLVRNVARIDICINKPFMVLKKAVLLNAVSEGFVFPQATTAAPTTSTTYTVLPISKYTDLGNGIGTGIKYIWPANDSESLDVTKAKNTLKHVFYLYEQINDASSCATVQVTYDYPDKNGKLHEGVLDIPLKNTSGYINTTRNYLYTIVLGDGTVDDQIIIPEIIVNDWIPNDIYEIIGSEDATQGQQ